MLDATNAGVTKLVSRAHDITTTCISAKSDIKPCALHMSAVGGLPFAFARRVTSEQVPITVQDARTGES